MSINNFEIEEAVEQLIKKGYCKVPFNNHLLDQAQQYFTDVLHDLFKKNQTENLRFTVPGESEADVGLIPPRAGKDIKWFFHYNLFLSKMMKQSGLGFNTKAKLLLETNQDLYLDIYELATKVVTELEDRHQWTVLASFHDCVKSLKPYSTSTLRSLWYPGVELQKGAKPHIDRGLLAIHLGDRGGDLIKLDGPDDQVGQVISPGPGEAVIFPGVKALWASGGRVGPLWHKSTTVPYEDRRAMVSFWHTEVPGGYMVEDAIEAHEYFYQEVKLVRTV